MKPGALAPRRHVAELRAKARVCDPLTLPEITASDVRWFDQSEDDQASPLLVA